MSATEYSIGRHCGVTFAGLKIASLVSLRKGEEEVIQTLSRRFAGKGFAFILLREDEERLLVYVCHRARLEKYLLHLTSGRSLRGSGMNTARWKKR